MPISKFGKSVNSDLNQLKKENEELKVAVSKLTGMMSQVQKELKQLRTEQKTSFEYTNKIEKGISAELHDVHQAVGGIGEELHDVHQAVGGIGAELHDVHVDTGKLRKTLNGVSEELHDMHLASGDLQKTVKNCVDKGEIRGLKKEIDYKICRYIDHSKYETALSDWYYEKMGVRPNLKNPKTFNEIIQWTKLYDIDELKVRLVDKYKVRDWVADKIGEKYLVPLLGVWTSPEEIDYSVLPEKFVLKCNHGCGYNIIVTDKSTIDINETNERLARWLQDDYAYRNGFELQYAEVERCIIAEEYMENDNKDLYDYKVFCFNGKARYVMYLYDRKNRLKMQIYDLNWNLQPFAYTEEISTNPVPRPDNLDELIGCAEKLAEGFIQARIDFYRLNDGTLKFGEITFTSSSGVAKWNPKEYDRILGDMIKIPRELLG